MRLPTLFFVLFLAQFNLFAGGKDSLVKFSDLVFKNDPERSGFKQFQQKGKQSDVIDLFLAHYSNTENYSSILAHEKIVDCTKAIEKECAGMAEPKKIRFIYKYVQDRFFRVYKLNNSFSDIFIKGEYNCVSGSALYAIIFQELGIPYQIVEAPQHVFLFAYPQSHKIAIETTSPKDGYLKFSERYVEEFVKYMSEVKLISQLELESSPPAELFNKYYFDRQGMSIHDLVAIQYANYGYYHMEKAEAEMALQEVKKAYYLHPGDKNEYMLRTILMQVLANRNYEQNNDVNNLALLCRFNSISDKEISDEAVRQEFGKLSYKQLITDSDPERYSLSYEQVYAELKDSVLKAEIAFIYHYEMARLGNTSFKSRDYEIKHLKNAYLLNPKHTDLQMIIKSYFAKLVEHKNDAVGILKEIDSFTGNFSFLENDDYINTIRANCLLELSYQEYTLQNAVKGELNLNRFEELHKKNPGITPNDQFIEKAYSTAAAYHYKKGNKTKTRELLKTGIRYAPESFGLKVRLNQVK